MKRIFAKSMFLAVAAALVFSVLPAHPVFARPTNFTYTYNEWNTPIPSPDAYRVSAFILGEHLGVGHFNSPQDLFAIGNLLHVVDTGNNRIVVIEAHEDASHTLVDVITHVYIDGESSTFNQPFGLFVRPNGHMWIADTHNQRILHVDENRHVVTLIDRSKLGASLLPDHMDFLPRKLAVDFSGRLFVQAMHVNRGLMEFDNDGYFVGYMGAPPVSVSPVDQFWRMIATREQRERMFLFVPVEYNNVTLDSEGFLFVTTTSTDVEPIRRLNAMGDDVMIRNGTVPMEGDVWWGTGGGVGGPSTFIDATDLPNGTFVVFDSNRGRLFVYDIQGELLYVFGGRGNREGSFNLPAAIDNIGFTLFALDSQLGALTRFDLTEYGQLINDALTMYTRGLYDESVAYWNEVLRMNGNFGLAYIGLARAFLRQGRYREAMAYFRLQNDNENYGRAFGFYRRQWMEDNFWMFALAIGILLVVPPVVRRVIRVRKEILES